MTSARLQPAAGGPLSSGRYWGQTTREHGWLYTRFVSFTEASAWPVCWRQNARRRGTLVGSRKDLHSNMFGGVCWLLAKTQGHRKADPAAQEQQKESQVQVGLRLRNPVTLSTGTLLLLIGAAALATGYLLPRKLEGIGEEEEFLVLDQQAVEYNHALGICRAVGTVLCAMAGALLVSCVLCSRLCRGGQWGEDGLDKEEQESPPPGQQRGGTIVTAAPAPFRPLCVQSVQPKRET
ncbi:neurensin-2 [Hemicordylus capensis]|uniref:neurensin-2 n=1 Tax=Hemicordylus capensis TaxID=884348 RepID=UPI002302AF3B|nr:neurensin-2 [Hemicordylus capensis]